MINRIRNISDLQKTFVMMIIWGFVIVLLIILSGCSVIDKFSLSSSRQYQQTSIALDFRSTQIALQATQLYQGYAETIYATRLAQDVQATLQTSKQLPNVPHTAQQGNDYERDSNQKPDTQEVSSINVTPLPTGTPIPEGYWEDKIPAANILLFEDMAGRSGSRYIKAALDAANYSYTDVGSAQGWLKTNILSNGPWDLIIVASEARTKIQGEFFDMLLDEIHSGTAVIIEIWDGDFLAGGKLGNLLTECGVEVHGDWYNPSLRAIYWLTPDHPIFQQPNRITRVRTNYFWADDIGDFMRLLPNSDATLLAGAMQGHTNDHGLITTCFGGRVVIQSFSDHDYDRSDMMHLWQNYVYYTLKNHYLFSPE
ncbi:MAG: hypothetical protein JW908_13150 [Anaerolineales bacterium]|nr:hypothetical protein [Anaerolineales bacterium]